MDVQGYLETLRLLPRSQYDGKDELGMRGGRWRASQQVSVWLVLVALGFMYSVHNLIAPNMTAVAKGFKFNNYERDAYIGGELTMVFYFPGVLGALVAGVLSGIYDRQSLLAMLAVLTGLACFFTARVWTFGELAWARALTGFSIGASLPVVYSLIGDWFPAKRRARATAFVTAASGAGVFVGQCVATVAGTVDWRCPFVVIAIPSVAIGILIWYVAQEPIRGGQEDGIETQTLYQNPGLPWMPLFSSRQLRGLLHNRTNVLVILQAFPGNIPWGVIIVYIHDFLVQDLGLSTRSALGSIGTLAAAAFAGVLTGGFVGELLYGANSRYLAIFGGICNIARAVPFFILFGWKGLVGPLVHTSDTAFFLLLMVGGFIAPMASACTGAMLLNVNPPELRGSVMALNSVLDDFSKGVGTLFVSMMVPLVGGRAVAYQLSLLLWVLSGGALLYTWYTYDEDEQQMLKNLEEAAKESMVLLSKQRAQEAIRGRSRAAGAAHSALASKNKAQQTAVRKDKSGSAALGAAPLGGHIHIPIPPAASATGCNHDDAANACSTPTSAAASQASSAPARVNLGFPPTANIGWAEQHDRVRRAARAAAEAAAVGRQRQ